VARPRVNGICLVKNEDDVIAQSLTYAAQYCDHIYVIDNGSSDETWSIVNQLARVNRAIIPFERIVEPYGDWLRARVFNEIHSKLSDEDWWMILDADEFFVEDPRLAIEVANTERADFVNAWQIQFYFTERDLKTWEEGNDRREIPIFERRRYYQINWQEVRLFRNQPRRYWDTRISIKVPNGLNRISSNRPFNRHYQFRDPEQIERRVALRYGHPLFPHVQSSQWRKYVRDSRRLNFRHDNDAWHFSPSGLLYFYRRRAYYRMVSAGRMLRRAGLLLGNK
jgi:hypothetical protein